MHAFSINHYYQKTTVDEIQNVCSRFGLCSEIVLPPSKTMPGRSAGFAFVQFKTRESAEKARDYFNANKFKGRFIAADWALPKDTYETAIHEERDKLKKNVKFELNEDVKLRKTNHLSVEEVKEDHDEENNKIETKRDIAAEECVDKKNAQNLRLHESSMEDSAINEHRVVFVRNLSFTTNDDILRDVMGKFGEVKQASCCKFQDSGHPKGTAFIHFSTAKEAEACVKALSEGFVIDGREVKGLLAIQRKDAAKILKEKSMKLPKDNRNLRLLRFSLIREGTSAAKGMSKEDATKRQRLAEVSRKKLSNLHMFVSPTRLLIHNLPLSMTDEALRKICREAAGKQATITECRIWKDTSKLDAQGNPRSKGFAFVNFSEHKAALDCLLKLNNNPYTFTDNRRPIVEFSIENLAAVKAKAHRKARDKGEKLTECVIDEKIKQQVKQSIGMIHQLGMKAMPKFLGKKTRHKNMSKTQLRKKNLHKKKIIKQESLAKDVGMKKSKMSRKHVIKYLTLSS
ncbi:hypothetical protein DICVIV_08712 [Dictyocaulus viviparus]|uniref:RRM domain-containing protein n=1 Tax=Dictyocaulus viviparus TaxID=29172 RepID=A0A0D8XKW3_DICVI|nr:hypothetical protein DICVIV_08712 [Dictyocaulus viviparus]